ncbi:MAG: hypothetical protein AAGA99_00580 [Actinomycetota bacterium]
MSDHYVDIVEYAKDLAREVAEALHADDENEPWAGGLLEVEHFRSGTDRGRVITHVLLTYGGPTVRVTIWPDDSAELFHSWGARFPVGPDIAEPCTTWDMGTEFGEQLRQLVGPWD